MLLFRQYAGIIFHLAETKRQDHHLSGSRRLMRPQSTSVSIVLLGAFAPDRLTPAALASADVISKKDAEIAIPRTLLPGAVSHFDFHWGELSVTAQRFFANAKEAPYVRACDLVVKALRDLLPEARVTAFGINLESHFDLGSTAARDALGRRLAPPEAWGKWGEEVRRSMDREDSMHGGMVRIQMRLPFRDERISGWLDVSAEPSSKISGKGGVVLRSNHHHQFAADLNDKPEGLELVDALAERFDASVLATENIFGDVIESEP
jgi:hypothetical protein